SSSAGLFAFVNGGADIKRLHAGHASREGLQAALLAEQGVQGPPAVIESRDGFMQAFAFGRIDKARPITLPPPFGITDCYIKPYACCRHIQPAVEALIEAMVAGYEIPIAIARACHPDLRQRGFHPTGACAVFGAAVAVGKLRGLTRQQLSDAMGIAASSSAGLFAFVTGGADIKRLHAGHASREGLQAALLAEQGVAGPPAVIESRDGFMQAFAFGRIDKARPVQLPPPFGITDCYIKPYACCRHIQPAVEALIGLLEDEKIAADEVTRIDVETYRIAAEHAHTGWDDYASAQLSFPYLIGLALRLRGVKMKYFEDATRRDPAFGKVARMLHVTAPPEIDRLYPQLRPARVTVTTARGAFTRQADEALGSRIVPLGDAGLKAKFHELVEPVLGAARARELADRLWEIETADDVRPVVELAAKP
ncbi:MAG: hypothetical protein QOG74_3389, partial [Alphaproteobacteria bacterium]|nr:hypothetical protein [Alphaproteobacteria bacterium]